MERRVGAMASCPGCGYRYTDPGCQCERLEQEQREADAPDRIDALEAEVEELKLRIAALERMAEREGAGR